MTVYTWGYFTNRTPQDLSDALAAHGVTEGRVLPVDVRFSTRSRNPHFNDRSFKSTRGLGGWWPVLGNRSRKLPWKPERGAANALKGLAQVVRDGMAVVLICAEADHRKCHRTEIAQRLAAMTGAEVVHL